MVRAGLRLGASELQDQRSNRSAWPVLGIHIVERGVQMVGSESLVRGKTRGKMFLFLVNFSPALYYLKAWNRLRTATLPPFK